MTITAEKLRELLDYDPDTGFFTWRATRGHAIAGVRAGHVNRCAKYPHRFIQIDGRGYQSGRLAWLHVHGEWPKRIFRCNGDRLDDRIDNLKSSAPVYRGARIPGVYQVCNKFDVRFRSRGKCIYVGCFDSFEQAKAALIAARRKHQTPSKFFGARWIYKVERGWTVRVKLKRKARRLHLGTFATLEQAQTALARARAPKPPKPARKHWWDDPGAMAVE
jgi:hypothetical protein